MTASQPALSLVIPVFNNGRSVLASLVAELDEELDRLDLPSEIVFVDDGSGEETRQALADLVAAHARVRVVELVTNFGQHAAFTAGFERARGRYLVTMDADGQADPRDIPKLIAPLREGYDLVSGVRRSRQDPRSRRVISRFVSWLVGRLAGARLRDIGCPFNAFTADVAQRIAGFGELRRFLKPLAVRVARRVTEVDVTHRPRPVLRPESSYSANRLVRLFMDFFVNSLGDVFAWVFLGGVGLAAVLAVATVAIGIAAIGWGVDRLWVLIAAALTVQASLVALLGLAGDYVQRIYRQSSGRPFYAIACVHEHAAPQDLRAHVS
jgi:glycosyltransferase involved in cell wall biosynthesis